MSILSADIKLLKSAVMADTSDGGGAMTGIAVVDGQSNNLFPDSSAMDRAFGRFQCRKVFGVAHSDDTDTFMGAHAILIKAPEDPLVHCALLKTAGWADTRATAQEVVERYLVKGPRLPARLYDMHYAGAMQIKLVAFVNGPRGFPESGDCIVLRNTAGDEQYVRITKVTTAVEQVAVVEGNGTVVLTAWVAVCQLGKDLKFDFDGPAPARIIDETAWAQVFTTSVAGGAKFYGIKPLAVAAKPDDFSATVAGGIFTPIVPAATVESPVIDRYPLTGRGAVCSTARAPVALTSDSLNLGPGSTFMLPTAVEPRSLTFMHGGTQFDTDNAGNVRQGTLMVGTVDHAGGRVTMASGAPNYGQAAISIDYRPATSAGAAPHSAAFAITAANQGLGFTNVFEPPPAPGSFSLAYMAQGRWYEMLDNITGKVAGADSSYGVGTLSYGTGSMSVTLGAVPDVGSVLMALWGDGNVAKALAGALPARLRTPLPLPPRTTAGSIAVAWRRDGINYTATTDAAGKLIGHATGGVEGGVLQFEPGVFPDGDVTLTCTQGPAEGSGASSYSAVDGYSPYKLGAGVPIIPGTFRGTVLSAFDPEVVDPVSTLPVWDANGVIWTQYRGSVYGIGTIDYNTGDLLIAIRVDMQVAYRQVLSVSSGGWNAGTYYSSVYRGAKSVGIGYLTGVHYAYGDTGSAYSASQTPGVWTADLPTEGALLSSTGLTFVLGADVYTAAAGALRRGWSVASGAPSVTAAGSVSSAGLVSVSALPADFVNAVTWCNVAVNMTGGQVDSGVFRTDNAPLKAGVFQLQNGSNVAQGNSAGALNGGGFSGSVDYQRGIVTWRFSTLLSPEDLSYNAVFLQYLPLDAALLGLETARLPLDGKVPAYRPGDLCVVHNTQSLTLPNPVPRDVAQQLGRQRLASVQVKDALGAVVTDTLYTVDLDAGDLTVPTASDLTAYVQPLTAEHRIEDMVVCSLADISGKLSFISNLTHHYPATTSFVSSALPFGDMFARAWGDFEQETWTGEWSNERVGSALLASFNMDQFPIVMTNRGAITERWALIFTSDTAFRIVGESVGVIGTGTTGVDCAPVNPVTHVPYFFLPAVGWGSGWAAGNVERFNTDACGAPFWPVRTILQGPATALNDQFAIAYRGDFDRP